MVIKNTNAIICNIYCFGHVKNFKDNKNMSFAVSSIHAGTDLFQLNVVYLSIIYFLQRIEFCEFNVINK